MADTLKQHIERHDREIAEIRGLMRQLARGRVQLQAAQKRTEQALANYTSRSTPRNGHAKRKVDLQ